MKQYNKPEAIWRAFELTADLTDGGPSVTPSMGTNPHEGEIGGDTGLDPE